MTTLTSPDTNQTAAGLTERQLNEIRFHDAWADEIDFTEIDPDITFEAPTAIECQFVRKQMGNIAGKTILDLGCGSGEAAVYFAKQGATVFACDISPRFVDVAGQLAAHHNVSIDARVSVAEQLPYGDATFDYVFANGVLHHVDIPPAMAEIRRVLKPGGTGFFVEPLPYNPVINVYRVIAKEVRTPDEKPLTYRDIGRIRQIFAQANGDGVKLDYFWLFALGVFLYFFFIERASTNERYWKKILYEADRYKGLFGFLNGLDNALLPVLPFLKPLCWNMVIQTTKGR